MTIDMIPTALATLKMNSYLSSRLGLSRHKGGLTAKVCSHTLIFLSGLPVFVSITGTSSAKFGGTYETASAYTIDGSTIADVLKAHNATRTMSVSSPWQEAFEQPVRCLDWKNCTWFVWRATFHLRHSKILTSSQEEKQSSHAWNGWTFHDGWKFGFFSVPGCFQKGHLQRGTSGNVPILV